MVDAFVYMYFVGAGVSLGVASVVLLSFKVYQRMKNKPTKKRKGAAF
ncbi:hypothetical protein LCY76_22770 [Fictibacillus sp. KIGAM418]|uniref:Uncharacterized protein n=1 Tax=Fictibacillus marinisediminis TaxID=2878389 RepID=A0A9X1XEM7_9BACL|nr:hypothetical protein [Fictibacillus marinisediminis]MCK6259399.1 hypothetical protein [Fictibacillus marinisediminis]